MAVVVLVVELLAEQPAGVIAVDLVWPSEKRDTEMGDKMDDE